MNKKSLLVLVTLLAGAAAAHAGSYTGAGCGVGAMLMKGQKGNGMIGAAAFTNGSFCNSFSITTETMGCTADGVVKNEKKLEVYAAANLQKLSKEMAQGGGEYLAGLSKLMGVKEAQKEAFFRLAQQRYEKILPSAATDSAAMIKNLRAEMASDPALSIL
ncbi:MAG: DUF3015 family protein [Elusimicrobia bacterium]|nr:DUF3015 family protein [Elusimicrobiota bacterium]